MNNSVARQLSLIAEVFEIANGAGVECWLRGGWAVDFFLGKVIRTHHDIDLFVWASDAVRLDLLLQKAGYEKLEGPTSRRAMQFLKDRQELHVVLLARTNAGSHRRSRREMARDAVARGNVEWPAVSDRQYPCSCR